MSLASNASDGQMTTLAGKINSASQIRGTAQIRGAPCLACARLFTEMIINSCVWEQSEAQCSYSCNHLPGTSHYMLFNCYLFSFIRPQLNFCSIAKCSNRPCSIYHCSNGQKVEMDSWSSGNMFSNTLFNRIFAQISTRSIIEMLKWFLFNWLFVELVMFNFYQV